MEPIQPTIESSSGAAAAHKPVDTWDFQGAFVRILRECFTTPRGWCLICVCFAFIAVWPARHHIGVDGLSYLDIGSEASSGDLRALGNSYWSPAYPALIAGAIFLLRPTAGYEVPVVQLVDLVIFIFTVWAFSIFYRCWSSSISEFEQAGKSAKGLFTLFSFACFLWYTSSSIGIGTTTPDMLVMAGVLLVAAMGCRISSPGAGWKQFVGLGALLGAGIYVKAALFPLGFAFIALLFLSLVRTSDIPRRTLVTYLALTTATCFAVATPLVAYLSFQAGKFSTGETGKLNYLWRVDKLKPDIVGWTGGTPPEYGAPLHPPRKLIENPTVLEFATPVAGTYPLWHSPGYWYAGAKAKFNFRKQVTAVGENLIEYYWIAHHSIAFVGGAILLLVFSLGKSSRAQPWHASSWLLAWPLAACAMYALVNTHERYVVPFLLLLSLEVYRALVFRVNRRVSLGICAIVLLVAMTPVALSAGRSIATTVSEFRHPADEDYVVVAHNLKRLGLQPGDKLAVIGGLFHFFYARYDRLRVVSQFLSSDEFWQLDPADAKTVESRLASIGIKALVAVNRPQVHQEAGWIEVGTVEGRHLSVLLLQPAEDTSR